jgi:hypothetical protein
MDNYTELDDPGYRRRAPNLQSKPWDWPAWNASKPYSSIDNAIEEVVTHNPVTQPPKPRSTRRTVRAIYRSGYVTGYRSE